MRMILLLFERGSFILLLCVIWATLSYLCPVVSYAEGGVVAKVGDTKITESDLQGALLRYVPAGAFHATVGPSRKQEYRKAALDDLIETELLYQEALKRGITAPHQAVQKVLDENIKRYGSEDALQEALENNGLTMEAFKEKITKYEMAAAVLKELADESVYPDSEVKAYYQSNRSKYKRPEALYLYHILISVEPTAPEEEWQRRREFAENLLRRIRAGEDFGALARQYSDDPYRVKGGEIGYVHRGRLTPQELEDAAFSLKEGEVSPAVRTIYGFHILKAGKRKPAETVPFDEVKAEVKRDLEKRRFDEKKEEMLERLRKAYPVVILENGKSP